jgi:hypothetical protein
MILAISAHVGVCCQPEALWVLSEPTSGMNDLLGHAAVVYQMK